MKSTLSGFVRREPIPYHSQIYEAEKYIIIRWNLSTIETDTKRIQSLTTQIILTQRKINLRSSLSYIK